MNTLLKKALLLSLAVFTVTQPLPWIELDAQQAPSERGPWELFSKTRPNGTVSIYNFDSGFRFGKIAIDGPIDKAVAVRTLELIRLFRRHYDVFSVVLNSTGGDVMAAIDIGEEVRKQWVWTEMDDAGHCLSACVLILAAGVQRIPAPNRVGIHRPYFNPEIFANLPPNDAREKYQALAKDVQQYLSRMGMPDELFREMMRQSSSDMLILSAERLSALGLHGIDPAYEEWMRARSNRRVPQSK